MSRAEGLLAPTRAALDVATELDDPGRAHDAGQQRATDRRQQQRHPERKVAGRAEEADLHARGVLEDEHEQHDQDNRARNERAERDPGLGGRRRRRLWPRRSRRDWVAGRGLLGGRRL